MVVHADVRDILLKRLVGQVEQLESHLFGSSDNGAEPIGGILPSNLGGIARIGSVWGRSRLKGTEE